MVYGLAGANMYGLLPRVERCADGSYCCDTDPKCCSERAGTFLDGRGNIVPSNSGSIASGTPTSLPSSPTLLPTPYSSTSLAGAAGTDIPSSPGYSPRLTGTSSSATLPNSGPNPNPSHSSFPVAAQAGIGIAVGLSFLSLVALTVLLFQKRRRLQNPKPLQTPPIGVPPIAVHLVDSIPRYELHSDHIPAEMPGSSSRQSKAYLV